jgi:Mn2+/Fe2+ NRAMP family transporter
VMLALGFLVVVTGIDPILVTEVSVIFSVVALPLTYLPILLVANDRAYMGRHANGLLANVFGVLYLVVIVVIAVAAIPLMIASNLGQG